MIYKEDFDTLAKLHEWTFEEAKKRRETFADVCEYFMMSVEEGDAFIRLSEEFKARSAREKVAILGIAKRFFETAYLLARQEFDAELLVKIEAQEKGE